MISGIRSFCPDQETFGPPTSCEEGVWSTPPAIEPPRTRSWKARKPFERPDAVSSRPTIAIGLNGKAGAIRRVELLSALAEREVSAPPGTRQYRDPFLNSRRAVYTTKSEAAQSGLDEGRPPIDAPGSDLLRTRNGLFPSETGAGLVRNRR